ncbi:aldolase/citrate lyase family protein [Amycolatopsis sp. OK19-0408]|uniref:Aldolase/citrate lyase family protein n=1 Tax=Amycolatopsis iheyensis TaxID=2945988 RepID=A0A9X2NDJ5_9PSEU|nr:aldolase/citrate lyase family protein [Amycolatopsis iheyensis]MCR6486704.1 aldolase/citrate lyase family protein [Amycolatopsis iheyensis]
MIEDFVRRVRSREAVVGYWLLADSPVMAERLATGGYDYLCLDQQHGLMGYHGIRDGLLAIDAGGGLGPRPTVGLVRTAANDPRCVGQALDAGAAGVIVPMIDDAEAARAAVRHAKYPPQGRRSYGPMRAELRRGPDLAVVNDTTLVAVMIETASGLEHVEEIAAVPGVDALYVGPYDLALAIGDTEAALKRILLAAHDNEKPVGIHADDGAMAAERLALGFDFVSIEGDLVHLEQVAQSHLDRAHRRERNSHAS